MSAPVLRRGIVFRAEHDDSFGFWVSEGSRSKLCVVFNAKEPEVNDDVHYFLATSKVARYRENPTLLSDVLILPAGLYACFPEETLIDFRELCVVPFRKLVAKNLTVAGVLSDDHVRECEKVVGSARILENRAKKLLGLR